MTQVKSQQKEQFLKEVIYYVKAGYQVLNITTSEEERVAQALYDLLDGEYARELQMHSVLTWDCVNGLKIATSNAVNVFNGVIDPKTPIRDPIKALDLITSDAAQELGNFIVIMKDLDAIWSNNPPLWRQLRNIVNSCALFRDGYRRPVFLVGNSGNVPENIKSEITNVEFALPDEEIMQELIDAIVPLVTVKDPNDPTKIIPANIARDPALESVAVRNLLGLTYTEAENAITLALSKNKAINHNFLTTIREQKAQIFRKSEVLTYIPEGRVTKQDDIAGYNKLFEFIDRRSAAYSKKAEQAKIDKPKGVILLGPPGTGKSIVAELITNLLGMPGYQMDVGALLGSLVGESERKTRTILRQLQAEKGCVVILDEADKAFSGMQAGNSGDSGTSQRVFGQILSFLARQNGNTFVVMTMNRVDHLPPELLRPGRFDAIFYTDMPNETERRQVFDIHFAKRGVNTDALNLSAGDWKTLIGLTANWTQAEIEAAVIESRYVAFQRDSAGIPNYEELVRVVKAITPSSKHDAKGTETMLEFCKKYGRPVTAIEDSEIKLPVKRDRKVTT